MSLKDESEPITPLPADSADAMRNEYDRKLAKEIERFESYRASIKSEYEQRIINEEETLYRAKQTIVDGAEKAAQRIVYLALGQIEDTSPATQFQAAKFIYERAVGNTDNPEQSEMDNLLDKLRTPVEELVTPEDD